MDLDVGWRSDVAGGLNGRHRRQGGPGIGLKGRVSFRQRAGRGQIDDDTALDGLAPLRQEIDAHPKTNSLEELPYASDVLDRYGAIIDTVHDTSWEVLITSIEDADSKVGAELIATTSKQLLKTGELLMALVESFVSGGLHERDQLSRVARLTAEVEDNAAQIDAVTGSPYGRLVDESSPNASTAAFVDLAETAMRSGEVDVAQFIDAAAASGDAHRAFFDRAETLLETQADQVHDDDQAEELMWRVAFAGAAFLTVVVATVLVVLALVLRSEPQPQPWS